MKLTLFKGEELPINYPTEKIVISSIEKKKKDDYDFIIINFATIVRNFITALDFESSSVTNKSKEKFKILKGGEFLATYRKEFKRDLELINTILNDNKIKPIYYLKDYKKLAKCNPNYLTEETMSPGKALTEKYIKSFSSIIDDDTIKIEEDFRNEVGEEYLLVTHNAVDLVSYQYQKNVNLVESFTGEIKPFNKWYTKYAKMGNNDMSILPFNGFLLSIFGCGNYIKPGKIKLRRNIYEIGKNERWNSNTTLARVKNGLEIRDRMVYNILKDLEKCYKKI